MQLSHARNDHLFTHTSFLHGRPFPHAKLQTNYNPTFPSPPYMCKSVDRPELLQALKHGRPSTLFLADQQGRVVRGDVRRHLTSTTSASPPSSPKPEARRRRTKTSAPSSCSSFWRTPPTPGRRCTSSWPRPRARRWRRRCRGATISTPPWSGDSRRWRPVSKC